MIGRRWEAQSSVLATERVTIREDSWRVMLEHARREAPRECCGLLLGVGGEVRIAIPARNELESTTRYRIHPRDHFAAIRRARTLQLEVIGAFHSHPGSEAVPSPTDLTEAWPDFLYVIVSSLDREGALRAWRLSGSAFVEVPLVQIGAR